MRILRKIQFWAFLSICSWLSLSPAPPQALLRYSDKLLHMAGYLALYLSARIACPAPGRTLPIVSALLAYSVLIETLQHVIPNRGFSLFDILANLAGLLIGASLYPALRRRVQLP